MEETLRLQIENISKSFPGVKALDHIKLHVKPGSVHALIGENGAGKSTLMKCLYGLYKPDEGEIYLDGTKANIQNPHQALKLGISMIQQEPNPIPFRNVIDNIWAGRFETKGLVVDEARMAEKTEELLKDLEFDMDPHALAKDLSVSQLQAIEIAKAVSYDARIIIMDEPTSSFTVAEVEHLFKIIRKLKSEGRSIIYISHKLEEIFQIADEITVMRDGQYIGTWPISDITIDELIQQMVGRTMTERFPEPEDTVQPEIMMEVKDFTSEDERSFKDVSFDLHKGEILGIGGLVGAQRTELIESIFGLRKITKGSLSIKGKDVKIKSPEDAIKNGIALLTEDRRATGIIPMLSVWDNTMAVSFKDYADHGYINYKKISEQVDRVCGALDVKMASTKTQIKNLSGGNQQKVLLARWLLTKCDIIMMDEPTRGVDVGAKYAIYKIMRDLVKQGKSIIMISSEMPELIGMSDRIMVMCAGHKTGTLDRKAASQTEIMRFATQFE